MQGLQQESSTSLSYVFAQMALLRQFHWIDIVFVWSLANPYGLRKRQEKQTLPTENQKMQPVCSKECQSYRS